MDHVVFIPPLLRLQRVKIQMEEVREVDLIAKLSTHIYVARIGLAGHGLRMDLKLKHLVLIHTFLRDFFSVQAI